MLLAVANFIAHANALPGAGIQRHHVANVDRRVLLDSPALRITLRGANVLPDAVDPFDDDPVLAGQHAKHLPGLSLVGAGDDHYLIARFNVPWHQTTSAARETIFMKFLSRNSRATAPKIRVPRGLF